MCDIDLKETSAYTRADPVQLDKFSKSKKQVYHIGIITNEKIRKEVEQFIRMRCDTLSILTLVRDISRYERMAEFLNQYCKEDQSICTHSFSEHEKRFKAFLLKNGLSLSQKRKRKDRRNDQLQKSDKLAFFGAFYNYVDTMAGASIPEQEKDVWDLRKLDITPENNPIHPLYRMDFTVIKQKMIRDSVKKVLYDHCSYKSCRAVKSELWAMEKLSSFLSSHYTAVGQLEDLTREMIEEFIIFLKTGTGLSISSYNSVIVYVNGVLNDWGIQTDNTEMGMLFVKGDSRTVKKQLPEFYSDDEIKRFNEALTSLEPQIMRCLVLHQILGTRIEEVLTLTADCLTVRKGQAYVTIYQHKVNQHYKKPVSAIVAELIKAALEETRALHPDTQYVFLQENGRIYTYSMVMYRINSMILELDLKDDHGSQFVFKTHKFRHTYGIKHAESNVDDKQLADLLGHHGIRSVHHYRMVRNDRLAEETRGLREELNEVIKDARRENNGKV